MKRNILVLGVLIAQIFIASVAFESAVDIGWTSTSGGHLWYNLSLLLALAIFEFILIWFLGKGKQNSFSIIVIILSSMLSFFIIIGLVGGLLKLI